MNNPIPRILELIPIDEPIIINAQFIEDTQNILVECAPEHVWTQEQIMDFFTYLHSKSVVELITITPEVTTIRNIFKENNVK